MVISCTASGPPRPSASFYDTRVYLYTKHWRFVVVYTECAWNRALRARRLPCLQRCSVTTVFRGKYFCFNPIAIQRHRTNVAKRPSNKSFWSGFTPFSTCELDGVLSAKTRASTRPFDRHNGIGVKKILLPIEWIRRSLRKFGWFVVNAYLDQGCGTYCLRARDRPRRPIADNRNRNYVTVEFVK